MMDMNFGKLRDYYDLARQEYPIQVIDYIFSLIGKQESVLDVGCGTGIATRQVSEMVENISGCDIDEKMIEIAKDYEKKTDYYVTPINNMPFNDEEFDVLTSFGAFHWFCDIDSVLEIQRVLKNKGVFIIINKNDVGDFGNIYIEIIRKVAGIKFPKSVKADYDPSSILIQNGFSNVLEKKFSHIEEFSVERAIKQIMSMNSWNFILNNKKQNVLTALRNYFEESAINGLVYRKLEIVVISGNK